MFHYIWEKTTLWNYSSLRNKILDYSKKLRIIQEEELQEVVNKLKEDFTKEIEKKGEEKAIHHFIVPIYGLVKEVIFRKTGLSLYPTQIFGGIVLNDGNIAQMNTGEGKTLTALLPVCLNALAGKSVYVVTVNEYLANRDWELAKPIFDYLGIPSAVNLNKLTKQEKKSIYENCKIIYTTSGELGFDYLRNNLIKHYSEKISMNFDYVLIDEIDSILIDEAQNPLIISKNLNKGNNENLELEQQKYSQAMSVARNLIKDKDYEINEKEKFLWLTDSGIKKVEDFYRLENMFEFSNEEINFLVFNCLKSIHFYKKGVEYIVDKEKNKILIIDTLTGRIAHQRVYGAGIHQAIETKEGLSSTPRGKSIATITYQNFFRLFNKISGMTGTAKTEAEEFRQVYGMEVIAIKPYKKLIRNDWNDLIFLNKRKQYDAVIKVIKENHQNKQRPILVGSPSLETSEYLSHLLKLLRIKHYKLNAVNHREEADIIAKAGQVGAVTIATNMAGRGTDIILSDESIKKGGLLLIGLGRNFSRRLDDQLKGRAGRQGNPGDTQFYISFEDELLKNFEIKEKMEKLFGEKMASEIFESPISNKVFDIVISEPQENIRNLNSSQRRNTLNYDLLINKQRMLIYEYRENILKSEEIFNHVLGIKLDGEVLNIIQIYQDRIKKVVVDEVDLFWANYLESLNKIRATLAVKVHLPQNPQEAFFSESNRLFQQTYLGAQERIKMLLTNFLD